MSDQAPCRTARWLDPSLGVRGPNHSGNLASLITNPDFEATSRELTTAYTDGSIVCRLWFRPRAQPDWNRRISVSVVRLSPFRRGRATNQIQERVQIAPASAAFLTNDPVRPRRIVDCISGTVTPDTVYFEPPVTDRPGMPSP